MATQAPHGGPIDVSPAEALGRLHQGYWQTQLIFVAATLGLADLLAKGPLSGDQLARLTQTHAPTLSLVLHALVGIGVLAEDGGQSYGLTPVGACLQADHPSAHHDWIVALGGTDYRAWGELLHAVKTGEPGFDRAYGVGFWQYFAQDAAAGNFLNTALARNAAQQAPALLAAYDFSGIDTLVDVGGGYGGLLAKVLRAHPTMTGVLFELPSLGDEARRLIDAEGVKDRCTFVGGDFLEAVPSGGDTYLVARCVRNWNDDRAIAILRNCRRGMTKGGRLLVVEPLVSKDAAIELLHFLVRTGGNDRTEAQHRALFSAAGFELTRVVPLGAVSAMEGVPAPASASLSGRSTAGEDRRS